MRLLLDTSFIIQLKKRNPKAIAMLNEFKKDAEDILISSLSMYELLCGAHYILKKYNSITELKQIERILSYLTEVPVDSNVAWKAAEVRAKLLLNGVTVPEIDLLIACSADEAKILTFDKDFLKLKQYGFDVLVTAD